MRLYDLDLSPFAARCRLAIHRKGLERQVEIVPLPEGGTTGAAYRAINPVGKVPALVLDDGTVIPESAVIAEYLEERFPDPPLLPRGPEARARARLVARLGEIYLMPPLGRLFGQVMRADARDRTVVDAALAELGRGLDALEHFLPESGWAAGPEFGFADCALPPVLVAHGKVLSAFGQAEPLGDRPRLAGYWRRVQADPLVAKVMAEMGAGLQRLTASGRQ